AASLLARDPRHRCAARAGDERLGPGGARAASRERVVNKALRDELLPGTRAGASAPAGSDQPFSGVGDDRPHESAHLHVAGAAPYVDDLPELAGTLHAALGLSPVAHGRLRSFDAAAVQAMPGVVAVIAAGDIPGV